MIENGEFVYHYNIGYVIYYFGSWYAFDHGVTACKHDTRIENHTHFILFNLEERRNMMTEVTKSEEYDVLSELDGILNGKWRK